MKKAANAELKQQVTALKRAAVPAAEKQLLVDQLVDEIAEKYEAALQEEENAAAAEPGAGSRRRGSCKWQLVT